MAEGWGGKERRLFPRLEVKIPLEYRIISQLSKNDFDTVKNEVFKNTVKNIDPLGLCIHTQKKLPPDTILELVIKFPEAQVKALAKVVWSKDVGSPGDYYSGVEFIAIRDKQINILAQCVAEYYLNKYKCQDSFAKSVISNLLLRLFGKKK